MTRHLRTAALVGIALVSALAWNGLRSAPTPAARPFPQEALPAEDALGPMEPVAGLDIAPTGVAAAFLDGDDRPDVLAWTANGDLRALRNIAGSQAAALLFAPAPFQRSYGGAVEDLLVQDLDGDGSHDLAVLTLAGARTAGATPQLALEFASGGGAFTQSTCVPELQRVDGYQPVSLGAADADGDGRVDLLLDLAPAREGRVGSIQVPTGIVRSSLMQNRDTADGGTGGSGGSGGGSAPTPAYVLSDPGADFTNALGGRVFPDIRDGRSYPVIASTRTTLAFTVEGASGIAGPGSTYRLLLPPDRTVTLRGLGNRCFAAGWHVPRPVYDTRHTPEGTVLADPDAPLLPDGTLTGRMLRYGPAPLAPTAPAVKIVAQRGTELTLDPAAGNLTSALHGVVQGGTPAFYAVVPAAMPTVAPADRLRDESSRLELPSDRAGFRPPGSTGSRSAAVADVTGDRRADLLVASGQLFLSRGK